MNKLTPENEQKILNPQIKEIQIGIREMRNIHIYPLSFADEIKLTDLLTEALQAFLVREQQQNEIVFVGFILELIKKNLSRILTMVSDEDGEKLLGEISNLQASEIANIIYEINFEVPSKNVKSLANKLKSSFLSVRQQPQSVSTTDTQLPTAIKNDGKKVG